MSYFVNVRWGLSERPFLLVIPAKGELAYVAPGFEESARARDHEVHQRRARVAGRRGLRARSSPASSRIAASPPARSASRSGCASSSPTASRKAAPGVEVVLATPVTAGCRMIKSPAEIALMQRANDITIEAFRAAFATLREGMTQVELGRNIRAAFDALGAPGGSALGRASASTPPSRTAASSRRR